MVCCERKGKDGAASELGTLYTLRWNAMTLRIYDGRSDRCPKGADGRGGAASNRDI